MIEVEGEDLGEITKTITIEVPSNVVYEAIKDWYLSGWIEKYCKDLTKGLLTEYTLSRDAPNSELGFTSSKWGTKLEEKYVIRPIGNFTEVSIYKKYRLTLDASARSTMIETIGSLLMLEKGYKSKRLVS